MSIWRQVYGSLTGGWKTYGPNSIDGPGAFDSADDGPYSSVTADTALKLSAVHACVSLRAEIRGSLPLQLRDENKKVLRDHPLYRVLHLSPNANQTAPEYWSMNSAHVDLFGNAVSIIERGVGKKVVALTPCDPRNCSFEFNKSGSRKTWKIGGDTFDDDQIFHLRGFSLDGGWGLARIDIGRKILQAQLQANDSAMRAFKQGLKVGGFFKNTGTKDLDTPELNAFSERLNHFGKPENAGKWMTLLRGLEPIAGTEFAVKPSDAQLLESRYFGIEEICRLFNTPPQLIGQTNKASSWASSIENINLFFLMYSLQPSITRDEFSISKKLLTPYDIANGVQPKWTTQALLRGDNKTRMAMYASGLQNGYYSQNEVRELEDLPGIGPEGDVYRVQLNMQDADHDLSDNPKKPTGEDDDK